MEKERVKLEISKLLNDVSEEVLDELLKYLRQASHNKKHDQELFNNFKKILNEDSGLLERLAK